MLLAFLLFVCSLQAQTLRKVTTIELPGPKGQRFDYLAMDDEDQHHSDGYRDYAGSQRQLSPALK